MDKNIVPLGDALHSACIFFIGSGNEACHGRCDQSLQRAFDGVWLRSGKAWSCFQGTRLEDAREILIRPPTSARWWTENLARHPGMELIQARKTMLSARLGGNYGKLAHV